MGLTKTNLTFICRLWDGKKLCTSLAAWCRAKPRNWFAAFATMHNSDLEPTAELKKSSASPSSTASISPRRSAPNAPLGAPKFSTRRTHQILKTTSRCEYWTILIRTARKWVGETTKTPTDFTSLLLEDFSMTGVTPYPWNRTEYRLVIPHCHPQPFQQVLGRRQ